MEPKALARSSARARVARRLAAALLWAVCTLGASGCVQFGWDRLSTRVPEAVVETIEEESLDGEREALIAAVESGTREDRPSADAMRRGARHIARRMAQLGIEPAGQDGFLQPFALNAIRVDEVDAQLAGRTLTQGRDLALWTTRGEESIQLAASLVFVGHGIVAPERDRDDYLGLSLEGKVALVLAGPADSSYVDSWYADHRYQCAEAVRHGAVGVLLVHAAGSYGSPAWRETVERFTRFSFAQRSDSLSHAAFLAWIPPESGDEILREVEIEPARARSAAATPGFRGRELGLDLRINIEASVTPTTGYNLVGVIAGEYADEQSILIGTSYDGSPSSLTSCASLLELAQAFTQLAEPTARSVVFTVFGAGAWGGAGQLGAESYAGSAVRELSLTAGVMIIDAGLAEADAGAAYAPTGQADAKLLDATETSVRADTLLAGGVLDSELGILLTTAALEDDLELRNEKDRARWFATAAPVFARRGLPSATVGPDVTALRAALRAGFYMGQTRGSPRWDQRSAFRFFPRR